MNQGTFNSLKSHQLLRPIGPHLALLVRLMEQACTPIRHIYHSTPCLTGAREFEIANRSVEFQSHRRKPRVTIGQYNCQQATQMHHIHDMNILVCSASCPGAFHRNLPICQSLPNPLGARKLEALVGEPGQNRVCGLRV